MNLIAKAFGDRSPEIGSIIDAKYELIAVLGSGGMGTVYKAKHLLMDRTVVLKMIHPRLAQGQEGYEFRRRFQREAHTASKLNHPHAVTVHDFGVEDGVPYLVMEYIEGVTLRAILRKGPRPLEEVLELVTQIGSAVGHAHQHGIIHRDLKPENIIVAGNPGQSPQATVLDFGLAKVFAQDNNELEKLTQTGIALGTPSYMSPEQVSGSKLDARSDIYALGVILYEMISGELPFKAESQVEVMTMHLSELPTPLNECRPDLSVPETVNNLVMKALEKAPAERQQSAEELLSHLHGALAETRHYREVPRYIPVRGPEPQTMRFSVKRSLLYSAIAGAVIALAGIYSSMQSTHEMELAALEARRALEINLNQLSEKRTALKNNLEETRRDYAQRKQTSRESGSAADSIAAKRIGVALEILEKQYAAESRLIFESPRSSEIKSNRDLAEENLKRGEYRQALAVYQETQYTAAELLSAEEKAASAFRRREKVLGRYQQWRSFATRYDLAQRNAFSESRQRIADIDELLQEGMFQKAESLLAEFEQRIALFFSDAQLLADSKIDAAEAALRESGARKKRARARAKRQKSRDYTEEIDEYVLRQAESGIRIIKKSIRDLIAP